jgi:hypothetical protein
MSRKAILIGNSRFPLAPKLETLSGPPNDVSTLAAVLADFGQLDTIDQLVERDSRAVHRAIEAALLDGRPSDFLLIFYSGHGTPDRLGNLCLASADTEDGVMGATSILVSNIKTWVSASDINTIVVILDCCYSGALWNSFGAKGDAKAHVKILLTDVADSTRSAGRGISLFASSSATQRSREETADGSGAVMGRFTRCVIDGLLTARPSTIPGAITVEDLRHYVGDHWNHADQTPDYWGLKTDGHVVLVTRASDSKLIPLPRPRPRWQTQLIAQFDPMPASVSATIPLSIVLVGLIRERLPPFVLAWIAVLIVLTAAVGAFCGRILSRRFRRLRARTWLIVIGVAVGTVMPVLFAFVFLLSN